MASVMIVKLILVLSVLLTVGAALILVLVMLSFFLGGAPFVPSPSRVLDEMMVLADIRPGEKVYDLGCGDGRLVIEAHKRHRAKAVGIEISPLVYALARMRAFASKAEVTLILGNYMDHDFSDADVIFCYLFDGRMTRLREKFKRLKPGCRIVSHQFEIPGWKPMKALKVEGKRYVASVFKYVV